MDVRAARRLIHGSVHAEDVVVCPLNSEMIWRRKAIAAFWGDVLTMGVKEAVLTTVGLSGSGNTLHELGTGFLKNRLGGQ